MNEIETYMQLALEDAYKSKGYTKTNPCVGAVIVKNGDIVARGWHKYYGGAHAEADALSKAGNAAEGADVFVTLEPCTTYGKTPPCAAALIKAGVKRVYIGVLDPNPEHAGAAVRLLKEAGIDVITGVLSYQCAELIEDFTKFIKTQIPYITMKIAQSLDGRIATRTGHSKWITSEESRRMVHELRHMNDAVLIGIGTALADDPELTVRHIATTRQPVRVVFDSKCRLRVNSKLVQGAKSGVAETVVFISGHADMGNAAELASNGVKVIIAGETTVEPVLALKKLGEMQVMNVFLEGGSTLFSSFLSAGLVDRAHIFAAPVIIGGDKAKASVGGAGVELLKDAYRLQMAECTKCGEDFWIRGKLNDYTREVLDLTQGFNLL